MEKLTEFINKSKAVINKAIAAIKTIVNLFTTPWGKAILIICAILLLLLLFMSIFGDGSSGKGLSGTTGGYHSVSGTGRASYSDIEITEEDREILYKITSAERGGGTQEQQQYVVSVILNRVLLSSFPNTVYGVVFQKSQFSPVADGNYAKAVPSDVTKAAVDYVIANGDTTGGADHFCTPAAAKNVTWDEGMEFLFNDEGYTVDGGVKSSHNFYRSATAANELKQYFSSSGLGEVANKSVEEKLAYLFPSGIPTSSTEMQQYLETVQVPMTDKNGNKYMGNLTVHKAVAQDVIEVFKTAQDSGFKIYDAGAYSWREMNNGTSGNRSHHSYGIAIDINVNENYSRNGSKVYAGSFWDPNLSEYSIPVNGALVNAFKAKGWGWGGEWPGVYQDYMHFSFTGY